MRAQEAQVALEAAVQPDAKVYALSPPLCVSCERPHSRLRYCHACGCELLNAFFECRDEDCPWEACGACCTDDRASPACAHTALQSHLLHRTPEQMAALLRRVKEAAESVATEEARVGNAGPA